MTKAVAPRSLSLILMVLLAAAGAWGCAAESGSDRPDTWKGTTQSEASKDSASETTQDPAEPALPPCREGAQHDCLISIEQANSVKSCWEGVQFCVDGAWSECYSLDELAPTPN